MENQDFIDLIFDKKEEDCIFNLSDNLLEELDNKSEISNDNVESFINKRINPKYRARLLGLMRKSENLKNEYHHRENRLYYRNGVLDGIDIVLMLSSDK